MRPVIVVHHLEQAKAALRIAKETCVDVQLRSAPGAAASVGVGYLHAMGEVVGDELLIDCGDDAGVVMAALRTGCKRLLFSGREDECLRLSQMAKRYGAELRRATEPPLSCLDLSPDDDEAAIRDRLDACFGD